MSTNQHVVNNHDEESSIMRDIHAYDPPNMSPLSRALSMSTEFISFSHEFSNTLVLNESEPSNLGQNLNEETDSLAVVANRSPWWSPRRDDGGGDGGGEGTKMLLKKEATELKINAWENAKIAKINNRFRTEEVIICGWEDEQVNKAWLRMKEVERKLEEKWAKTVEKMQNEITKAQSKAEEKKASAESKRGIKVVKVVQIANSMRHTGRAPPPNRSFFHF